MSGTRAGSLKHGHACTETGRPSPTYVSWSSMLQRCYSKRNISYPNYGGRGIKVCARWLKFENFLIDMGERPIEKTLDRRDPNGDYEPDNCRWATRAEQQSNKRVLPPRKSPRTHCPNGHEYIEGSYRLRAVGEWVARICITCGRARSLRWWKTHARH